MSKLSTVRKALEEDSRIKVVNTDAKNYFPKRNGYWSQTVDFWVAPIRGIYIATDLQRFLMTLVPEGLKPTRVDECRQYDKKSDMSIGVLYFDEKIAEERTITKRIITTTDDELSTLEMIDNKPVNIYGFENGTKTIDRDVTEPHKRRTWVRLYPDENIAKAALEGKIFSHYNISPKDLETYKQKENLFQRLVGK